MLTNLKITNLALIKNCELELREGLSVFTGETGAGKSVLMGAIGLVLGERAISEHIRSGEERAEVTGIFRFSEIPVEVKRVLDENDIEVEDGEIIIRRVISNSGRNRIFINQIAVPLATLKVIGNELIDLHGQHDHQTLLRDEAPYEIIDILPAVKRSKEPYVKQYKDVSIIKNELATQKRIAKELAEKREFLLFQFEELDKLALKEGEEEELEAEYKLISSVTDRAKLSSKIMAIVDGDGVSPSITSALSELIDTIQSLNELDNSFSQWDSDLISLQETLRDLSTTTVSYSISLRDEASPARVDYINSRLSKIQRLKKKYMCDFNELIEKHATIAEQLSTIENSDGDIAIIEKRLSDAQERLYLLGESLSKSRRVATEKFDRQITKEMGSLGFRGGAFAVEFVKSQSPTINGLESMVFTARTNRGEQFMPLNKTASGGEISRIMLAIKSTMAESDPVPILVFDEIDTGIGGEIASDIATAIVKLSSHHQIFVISHLQQIATRAQFHYLVSKEELDGRTVTNIKELSKSERVDEIARMLGGERESALRHARELIG